MFKNIAVGTAVLLLGGCAIPVPLQIASWALDGISVLTTQKSVTDHGISLVADKDCAVWRGVVDGELCREIDDTGVLVAENQRTPTLSAGFAPVADVRTAQPAADKVFVTNQQVIADRRQAGVVFNHAMSNTQITTPVEQAPVVSSAPLPKVTKQQVVKLPAPGIEVQPAHLVRWSPPQEPAFIDDSPAQGIYFVIGSFRNYNNAERLSQRHSKLSAATISAKLDGKKIYRVVIGPVKEKYIKTTHKSLREVGLSDTWAIRVNPSDWTLSRPRSKPVGEVARLAE